MTRNRSHRDRRRRTTNDRDVDGGERIRGVIVVAGKSTRHL
jgi:hypothetical protein